MLLDRLHFDFERQIRELHNHLYGNANLRTPEAIASEVSKIIKALMYARGNSATLTEGAISTTTLRDTRGELAREVAAETRAAFDRMNRSVGAYAKGTRIELDDASIAATRIYLTGFDFDSGSRDWLGDAIEIFRSITAKRLGGQFFTHPLVTELAMTLLEYRPYDGHDLVDICAGSGGFLLAGGHEMAVQQNGHAQIRPDAQLVALEADPELVRLTNSNLAMQHGIAAAYAMAADSLSSPDEWPAEVRRRVIPGTHRCLASNPPFGTKITVKDDKILRQFDLGSRWSRTSAGWKRSRVLTARAPDILFLERNLQLAEPGIGRVALVTPYQILSGPQAGFIRQWLLCHARILAVVDLPATTFQPHTGTKASLLVYERRAEPLRSPSDSEDYSIFMAVADDIGHDRRGNPVFASESAQTVTTDLYAVADAFRAHRRGEDPSQVFSGAFSLPARDVSPENDLRLNAAFYRATNGELRNKLLSLGQRPGWRITTVGEVTRGIFVPGRFKRGYVDQESGVPFLSGSGISQIMPTGKWLAVDDPHGQSCVVRAGWVLVTRSGSTGVVSSVPSVWDGWAVSDHVIRIVPDPSKLDGGYLQAYLRSSTGQALLQAGIFGSVIDEITPEHVASIPIAVPEPAVLAKIADNMQMAEAARASAHEGISAAVSAVEEALAA